MAKNKKVKKKQEPVASPIVEPTVPVWERSPVAIGILLLLTGAVYALSVNNGFVFFDDDKAILYNKALENPSISKFFTGQNLGMYAPVSWIGYWLGSLISGKEAWGYHLLGLLLHSMNTVLAYALLRRLLNRHWPAFLAAALFAVHPVQVEAVSWAAALSTVLFSSFYLLSAWAYVAWKRNTTPLFYISALLVFLLACLSKSAAVTLPLVLIAIDYYQSPKWEWKFAWNKIPFLAISLFFGAYTFLTRAREGHDIDASSSVFSAIDRFFMVCQTVLFYPVKLLVPFGFSVSYPFVKTADVWPWTYYAAPLVLAGLSFLVWKYWRSKKEYLLGIALYLLPLSVMLPFRTVGSFELRSDRYVYLSCLGLFLLLGLLLEKQKPALRNGLMTATLVVWGFLAFQQTKVWKDGIALFNNCVDKTPEASLCQCNLAYSELLAYKFEDAIYHYSESLKYDPSTVEAYNGRGQAYFQVKKIPEALDDFTNAIQAGIVTPKLFLNRGKCLVMLSRPQEALPDLDRSLQLEPNAPEAYYFRAVVHEKAGSLDQALRDYNEAVRLNPNYIEAIVNRALILVGLQQYDQAISDYSRAIQINPNMEMIYNNRGYVYYKNGQTDLALEDVDKAITINPRYARAYQTRAVINQSLGHAGKAQADMQIVQQLQQGQ